MELRLNNKGTRCFNGAFIIDLFDKNQIVLFGVVSNFKL